LWLITKANTVLHHGEGNRYTVTGSSKDFAIAFVTGFRFFMSERRRWWGML
jgi:hypothetical protein